MSVLNFYFLKLILFGLAKDKGEDIDDDLEKGGDAPSTSVSKVTLPAKERSSEMRRSESQTLLDAPPYSETVTTEARPRRKGSH